MISLHFRFFFAAATLLPFSSRLRRRHGISVFASPLIRHIAIFIFAISPPFYACHCCRHYAEAFHFRQLALAFFAVICHITPPRCLFRPYFAIFSHCCAAIGFRHFAV
jgi:hypothetical protein